MNLFLGLNQAKRRMDFSEDSNNRSCNSSSQNNVLKITNNNNNTPIHSELGEANGSKEWTPDSGTNLHDERNSSNSHIYFDNEDIATMQVVFKHLKSVDEVKKELVTLNKHVNHKLDSIITYIKPKRKFSMFTQLTNLIEFEEKLARDDDFKDHMVC